MTILAFDVGGTHLRSALVAPDLAVTARRSRPTPVGSAAALTEALIDEARQQCAALRQQPLAIGIAMAGFTNVRTGIVHEAPSLGLREALVAPPLRDALGLPVRLVNDVNAAAWAEARVAGSRDLLAILVGTGVGTGFVSGGTLIEGHHGIAAEGGHVIWREDGPPCPAGHRGCFESFLGGKALAARARSAGLLADAAELVELWRGGDPVAGAIMGDAVGALAALCRLLATLFDPERIVIGGGVALATPELAAAAARAVGRHPLAPAAGPIAVGPGALGDEAGLVGAALLAREAAAGR